MHWPPDIADDLPAPRDDEPESLRQDIADELADHLQCAFTRELHVTRDEQAAKEKAIDRFGSPRAIARKLWFDALKEQIMSQRLTLIFTSTMTIACLAAAALAWTALHEGRNVNAAILERLEALQPPTMAVSIPPEWSEVKVRAVLEEPDGQPAVGYLVSLNGYVYNTGTTKETATLNYGTVDETVGDSGVVDFGMLRGGSYTLIATTPWGESMHRSLSVRPGRPTSIEIVCPAKPAAKVKVETTVDWPEELQNRNYVLRLTFQSCYRHLSGNNDWSSNFPSALIDSKNAIAFVDGRSIKKLNSNGLHRFPASLTFSHDAQWTEGEYTVFSIEVYQPTLQSEKIMTLLATAQFQPATGSINGGGGFGGGFGGGGGGGFFQIADASSWDPIFLPIAEFPMPRLNVVPGRENHIEILLPDELIEALRDLPAARASTSDGTT